MALLFDKCLAVFFMNYPITIDCVSDCDDGKKDLLIKY